MPKSTLRIAVHSFKPRDAVGNFIQAIAARVGSHNHPCGVYAEHHIPPYAIKGNYEALLSDLRPEDVLLYHLTWGDPDFSRLMQAECKKNVYYHNMTPGYFFRPDFPKIAVDLERGKEILSYLRHADVVYANSAWTLQEICPYLEKDAIRGVMPPLTGSMLAARISGSSNVREFPKPYILMLGRIAPHKNLEWGLRLFHCLVEQIPELSCVIAGSCDYPAYMEKLHAECNQLGVAKDRIHWVGSLTDTEIAGYLCNAEGLLSTSLHEGFGMPLIEAMALDVPVYFVDQPAVAKTVGTAGTCLSGTDLEADANILRIALSGHDERGALRTHRKTQVDQIVFCADHSPFWEKIMTGKKTTRPSNILFQKDEHASSTSLQNGKNIVLLCRHLAQFGGIPTFTRDLAKSLADIGHTVHIMAETKDTPKLESCGRIHIHWLSVSEHIPPPQMQARRIPKDIWNWSKTALDTCRNFARNEAIDVVEAPIWDCEGIAFLQDGRWPLVTSLHTTYHKYLEGHPSLAADSEWMEIYINPLLALERELMTCSDAIRANSNGIIREVESSYYLTLSPSRCRVIYHGLTDVPRGKVSHSSSVKILYVGRFEHRKGVDLLLEAAPALLSGFPHVYMTLVGDTDIPIDSLKNEKNLSYVGNFLHRHAGAPWLSRIQFPGVVSDEYLRNAYSQCDIFCAPSRFESFGYVLLEAMRAGKPVVSAYTGGIPEVVQYDSQGYLFPPENVEALTWALSQLIQFAELRDRMGKAGRKTYETKFTAQIMAEKSLDLYSLAMSNHKNIPM